MCTCLLGCVCASMLVGEFWLLTEKHRSCLTQQHSICLCEGRLAGTPLRTDRCSVVRALLDVLLLRIKTSPLTIPLTEVIQELLLGSSRGDAGLCAKESPACFSRGSACLVTQALERGARFHGVAFFQLFKEENLE